MSSARDYIHIMKVHSDLADHEFQRRTYLARLGKEYDRVKALVDQAVSAGDKDFLLAKIREIQRNGKYQDEDQSDWPCSYEKESVEEIQNTLNFYLNLHYHDLFY